MVAMSFNKIVGPSKLDFTTTFSKDSMVSYSEIITIFF